jgi:hypothetical protein
MSLRKSPCLTPASLAARRANARKSTGPRTECGKARVALNPLKHGRRAVALRERLERAGYREGEAFYCRIQSRISKTLARPGDGSERQAERLASWIWTFRRGFERWQRQRAKLECSLESSAGTARLSQPTRIVTNCCPCDNTPQPLPGLPLAPPATTITIRDAYRRIGMVFYTQQRRHFTERRLEAGVLGLERFEFPGGALEHGLRCRVYRLARPRMWERMKFCLDRHGRYHPEWEEEFRRTRAAWRGTPMEIWLEPHPILATLRQKEGAGLG